MRIIGGNFKGKKILLPLDKNTRPLRDLVKESIFNLIQHSNKINLQNYSNVLDIFSGSGSFGLECVSRGAENVVFIENYLEALKILKKNIYNLKAEKWCTVIEEDCFSLLNSRNNKLKKFKLIFIDPPYKEKKINIIIEIIKKNKILDKNGIIILHRHKDDDIKITDSLQILDTRVYGISKIIIGKEDLIKKFLVSFFINSTAG